MSQPASPNNPNSPSRDPSAASAGSPALFGSAPTPPSSKASSKKTLAIAGILVCLIIAVGAAWLLITQHSLSTSSPKSDSPVATNGTVHKVTTVNIDNLAFMPARLTIKKGEAITWANQDNTVHAIAETDNQAGPHSQQLRKGSSYTYTFNNTGTFHYQCAIHPSMSGVIVVTN